MKKVLIGMSGGVDSSVAAAVLKEQGYEVAGAMMRLWSTADKPDSEADARRVCEHLGIDFYLLDLQDLFREKVVEHFVAEYIAGRTPNPCIVCNKYLKFGAMLEKAKELGFDYIATGHYAKIEQMPDKKFRLRMSEGGEKDQSYVLYNFTQEQLRHTLMPLGDYNKEWVRQKAQELNLPVANKPESMEICFVEDGHYADFIMDFCDYVPKPGAFVDVAGNVLGEHRGMIYYTVGQRKGLGAFGKPMFVLGLNPEQNTVILGEKGMEFSESLMAREVNFISGEMPKVPITAEVKIRYQAKPAGAILIPAGEQMRVVFDVPQRAVTPGQAVVFYDGDVVLGGGTVV